MFNCILPRYDIIAFCHLINSHCTTVMLSTQCHCKPGQHSLVLAPSMPSVSRNYDTEPARDQNEDGNGTFGFMMHFLLLLVVKSC